MKKIFFCQEKIFSCDKKKIFSRQDKFLDATRKILSSDRQNFSVRQEKFVAATKHIKKKKVRPT